MTITRTVLSKVISNVIFKSTLPVISILVILPELQLANGIMLGKDKLFTAHQNPITSNPWP